jgi:hypothetical protein
MEGSDLRLYTDQPFRCTVVVVEQHKRGKGKKMRSPKLYIPVGLIIALVVAAILCRKAGCGGCGEDTEL